MQRFNRTFIQPIVLSFLTIISSYCYAAPEISAQQLAQFQQLSPTQQQMLARSLGVNLATIQQQIANQATTQSTITTPSVSQLYPRGTVFDEFGNAKSTIEQSTINLVADDNEPKPFGYDTFANEPTSFAPSYDIAIPANYSIGAGDLLDVKIFGKENYNYQLAISREGQVVIPQLGAYQVAGLTFEQMKLFLADKIKAKILGVDVVITLAELRSIRVFVLGDAYKPGAYTLSSLSSITHALFAAGGLNDIGSLRNIQLKRQGELVTSLDLYDLLISGDSSNDSILQSGDVVFIAPVGNRVTVIGEVKRPAIYELAHHETFADVLNMAGGVLPSAYPKATVVERFNQENLRTLLNIDLSKASALAQLVQSGDVIRVMKTSEQYDQSITVIGAVTRPGKYQWQPEQQLIDVLPNIHAYTLSDADLSYGLVVREKDLGRNIEVLQFSLFKAITDKNSADNILLAPRDRILIFSNVEKANIAELSLDNLALTQHMLEQKEKKALLKKYEEKQFWQYYGEQSLPEQTDPIEQQLALATKSLASLTGGGEPEEVDIRELGQFSRKRLLAPIIEQLKRQGASGQPIALVEVVGAVKYPGVYPLAIDGKVQQLLAAAGGLLESAYLERGEITRDVLTQGKANKISLNVNLAEVLAGEEVANIELSSKDRLNVHNIPAWQENHIVELRGEFKFPGKYTIHRGESLRELIERAGGFTEYAYINASVFTREKLKQMELNNLVQVSTNLRMEIASKSLVQNRGSQSIDYNQAKALLADLTKVKPVGRLVVDLSHVMQANEYDVALEDGDFLYVPTKQNSINVIGQVQVSTSHLYQQNLSVTDYVQLSGGIKKRADESRIYVIKANGSIELPKENNWFASTSHSTLKPGDTVVVPLDSEYMDNLTLWSTATQILYQGAVAIAAIGKL